MSRRSGNRAGSSLRLGLLALAMLLLGIGVGSLLRCDSRKAPPPSPPGKTRVLPPVPPSAREPAQAPKGQGLPQVALVIDDLGYAAPELVVRLCAQPDVFSVAVLPYLEFTRRSAEIAHGADKEVLLHLPMEPLGYPGPGKDPGPGAIFFDLSEAEVRLRVRRAFAEVPFRTGVNNHMGSRITPDPRRMTWVMEEIGARGYFFVDSRTEKDSVAFDVATRLGVPAVQRKVFLDDDRALPEMERQWERALAIARKEGSVLVIGHIYPETLEALERILPRSRAEVRFVPASALAR
jgi:uncharacterized protein